MKKICIVSLMIIELIICGNYVFATENVNTAKQSSEVASQKATQTVETSKNTPEQPEKKKEDEKPTTPVSPTSSNSNSKNITSSSTNNKNTTKTATNKVVGQEVKLELKGLKVYGINENNEKAEIVLSPEFNSSVLEYTAEVESNIQEIEIEKDAGSLEKNTKIEGNTKLETGSNIFKVTIENKGKTVVYTITINKKIKEETKVAQKLERKEQEPRSIVGLVIALIVLGCLIYILVREVIKGK